jgi:hypothetical protein
LNAFITSPRLLLTYNAEEEDVGEDEEEYVKE